MATESIDSGGRVGFLKTPDGLRLRHGFWPARRPRNATLLILGGRTEFLEKYREVIGELTGRGYDVFGFDWRGQGLSERLLPDSNKCFIRSFDQYAADLDQVLHRLVYPRSTGPVLILAHSMGAHIALKYLDGGRRGISAAVLTAPMVDIRTQPLPPAWARLLSRCMVRLGRGTMSVPGARRHNPFLTPFRRNRLTSDAVRFRQTQQCIAHTPELACAEVTFGWLAATFASIAEIESPSFGTRIEVPILMVLSGRDRVVSNAAARRLALRLPRIKTSIIRGAQHEILQERDDLRREFWARFDGFTAALSDAC